MREDTTETVEKVPWFSDLPFFGWFFRRTQERDDQSQLMIFLTPSILPTPLTKAGSIKTANPQRTSRLPSAPSGVKSGQKTTRPQDQEAKRRAQSDNRPRTTGLQTTGPLTTETQTTNQQSAISVQPSALQKTDRQGAVGSGQEKQQRDQEAKRRAQSDNGQRTTGPLTTETQTTNQQSAISGQPSAKSETQSAKRQQALGQQDNTLPADRIW